VTMCVYVCVCVYNVQLRGAERDKSEET